MSTFQSLFQTLESRQLLSAGQLDTTYGSGGIISDSTLPVANGVAIAPGNKTVVAGTVNGNFEVSRYNSDGSPDTTFGTAGHVISDFGGNDIVGGVAVQSDGRIVVSGTSNVGGQVAEDVIVARYNTNGTLDTTFSGDGLASAFFGGDGSSADVAIQPNGQIVSAGTLIDGQSGGTDILLVRFNSDGRLDTSFGRTGAGITGLTGSRAAFGLAIQADGQIVTAGTIGTGSATRGLVARFNSSGQYETTPFTLTSTTVINRFNSVIVQSDGKIVAAGSASGNGVLARFSSFGGNDPSFGNNGVVVASIGTANASGGFTDIKQQADGNLVVGGFGNTGNATSNDFVVARYLANGRIDTNFGDSGLAITDFGSDDRINRIALQSDQSVVAAGASGAHEAIARYQHDTPPAPTATLISAPRLRKSVATYTFTIEYHAAAGIDLTTIDSNDIIVSGPNGFSEHATVQSITRGKSGSTRFVTYALAGPGGTWTAAANGIYTIRLQANQVKDTNGVAIPAQPVGAFTVRIPAGT